MSSITGDLAPAISVGDVVIRVNPRYFRPAEVETIDTVFVAGYPV